MKNKSIMIQGTGSSVGKSIICAALCRIFSQDGYHVTPFKSQNMSNNSFITHEGLEMGRAQVMQAEAAGKVPEVAMNPILLKPTTNRKSQIVIKGKVYDTMGAEDYFTFKAHLREMITSTYQQIQAQSDIVVIEGAGSPAEINLKHDDLVNMGMAKIARAPVILVGDIDRGGVFASLAGTMLLLDDDEKKMVKGVLINKFRGSLDILQPGLKMLEDIIKVPVLGVLPFFHHSLEDEDSVTDWKKFEDVQGGEIDIAVIKLPHISNFTDLNALRLYDDVSLRFVDMEEELGCPDVVIIPGTKSTMGDMELLRQSGMAQRILSCYENGSIIFGICGGFQILSSEIRDPDYVESLASETKGLGLIKSVTTFRGEKTTTLSEGTDKLFGCKIKGYEIHMGDTHLLEGVSSLMFVSRRNGKETRLWDGAVNEKRTVFGTYFHGIFDNSAFTRKFLNLVREKKGLTPGSDQIPDYWEYKEAQYDKLAQIVRDSVDMERIYRILEAGLDG